MPEPDDVDLTQMSAEELDEFAAWAIAVHSEDYENVSLITEWDDPHEFNQPAMMSNRC